ncbi:MAG: hypothetical protein K8R59_17405 [Thermoanaerobaculales bacterium]|nr:hypothetical protein [Thermoanaerobaculales bacterium]
MADPIGRFMAARLTDLSTAETIDNALGDLETFLSSLIGVSLGMDVEQGITTLDTDGQILTGLRFVGDADGPLQFKDASDNHYRMRVSSGDLTWEVSTDGVSWAVVTTLAVDDESLMAKLHANTWMLSDNGAQYGVRLVPEPRPGDVFALAIYRTEDSGLNWTKVNSMDLNTGQWEIGERAMGAQVAFLSSSLNVADVTWTPIPMNTVIFPAGCGGVPLPGMQLWQQGSYMIILNVYWQPASAVNTIRAARLRILPDGGSTATHEMGDRIAPVSTVTGAFQHKVVSQIFLGEDDRYYLTAEAYTKGDGTRTIFSADMMVYRVAGGI